MNSLKKIVNKISHVKSVFTPADKYNELVDSLNTSNDYLQYLKYKSPIAAFYPGLYSLKTSPIFNFIQRKSYQLLTESTSISLNSIVRKIVINDTNTAKTLTINQPIGDYLTSNLISFTGELSDVDYIEGSVINGYKYTLDDVNTYHGSILTVLLDNTKATTGNDLTLALFAGTGLTVNGNDSLVVAAGNVGKFEIVVTTPTTAKVCRVY